MVASQAYETVKLCFNYDAKLCPGLGGYESPGNKKITNAIMTDLRNNTSADIRRLAAPQNYKDPRILFHGTMNNPDFCQLLGKRIWTDPGTNELWTVALTEQNPSNIAWCLWYAMKYGIDHYVVIFEVIPNETEEIYHGIDDSTAFGESLPEGLRHSTSIIGRVGYSEGVGAACMKYNNQEFGFDIDKHPDSYVLTSEFQRKHTVVIRRIYKLIDVLSVNGGSYKSKVKKGSDYFEYSTSTNLWYSWCT